MAVSKTSVYSYYENVSIFYNFTWVVVDAIVVLNATVVSTQPELLINMVQETNIYISISTHEIILTSVSRIWLA